MVRSKFPGKPSKIVNRKVVKSSKFCVLHDNESNKAAENISYGLAVFSETFGDHEQVLTAFHGFSPHEVDNARKTADRQQEKVEEEYKANGLDFPQEEAFPIRIDPPTPQALSYVEANLSLIGPVGWHTTRAQCQSLQDKELTINCFKSTFPMKLFSPFKGNNLKKHVANRLLQKAKKTNLDTSPSCRMLLAPQLDTFNSAFNRKFVLPSRSLRSRRMIKPSKRLIDAGGMEKNPTSTSPNTLAPHTRVIELKKPRLIFEVDEGDKAFVAPKPDSQISSQSFVMKGSSSSLFDTKEHVKLAELNVFGAPTTRLKRRNSQSSADESPQKQVPTFPCSPSRPSPPDSVSPSKSKVIFRESKLNLISETEEMKEERSSEKPKKGPTAVVMKSPRISLECGVCDSVCFSRLTKQTLKFEAVCCELCRKFITRMMVRARSSENSVPCDNGQGNCAVSSPLKGESFATKLDRCGACWLLMCVQRLVKMPENIRDSLIRMLPANMQGMTVVLPPLTNLHSAPTNRSKRRKRGPFNRTSLEQDLTENDTISPNASHGSSTRKIARQLLTSPSSKRMPIARIRRKAALASLANNLKRVREKVLSPGSSKKSQCSGNTSDNSSGVKKKLSKKSETLTGNSEKPLKKSANKNPHGSKVGQTRQKLNPKGPRVKHVCRSASIVLGQPLATFPVKLSDVTNSRDPLSDLQVVTAVPLCNSSSVNHVTRSRDDTCSEITKQDTESQTTVPIVTGFPELKVKSEIAIQFTVPPPVSKDSKPISKSIDARGTGRKPTRHPHSVHFDQMLQRGQRRTLQDLEIMNSQTGARPELISLDFWESYDPDEVCNAGFSLVGFDPFNLKPVCFLCGSAGTKKLIHCASCCEPYHQFCVEMGIIGRSGPLSVELFMKDEWRVDWVCPRCTVCHSCGYNTGHQLTVCQRCHNSFHLECLGTSTLQKSAGDRLWVCSLCLRCKSCNSAEVTKFVGNLPFCKVCFKLRQKGNFCPLCQGCYTDDDYSSKMMECGDCKSWVHAKCEGLSDEKYQILSYLPESVEFICRVCCTLPAAPWWAAVEAELQLGFSNIIKALTKNRKTYAMLKWSPQKSCECQHKPVVTNTPITHSTIALGKRRLSFSMKTQDDIPSSNVILTKSCHAKQSTASSVFEFDDDIEAGETVPISSYKYAKEIVSSHSTEDQPTNLVLDCGSDVLGKPDKGSQFSPHTGSQSDSGVGSTDDELKTYSAAEEDDQDDKTAVSSCQECTCSHQNSNHPFATLLTIMKKTQSKGYSSVLQFHRDMDQLVKEVDSQEVKELYHQTLQEVFPWFDPKYDRMSRNSFPLSPCKPHHGSLLQYQPNYATPEKSNCTVSSTQILKNLVPFDLNNVSDDYFYYGMNPSDSRTCGFCKCIGDSDSSAAGRLLYCGQNEWVHINCALWSAEVFEEIDGALQNVSNALSRGRMIRCSYCGKKGASVGCCAKKCEETLHFPCARAAGFSFMEDKNVYCPLHTKDAPGKMLTRASDFDVSRPVFVELDRRKKKSVESKHVRLMIGSLLIQNLGILVPDISDQGSNLVPTQFYCSRLFWSSKEPWRIVRYTIKTVVRIPAQQPVSDSEHHITVDHSKENTDGNKDPTLSSEDPQVLISKHNESLTYSVTEENAQETENSVRLPHLLNEAKVVKVVMNHILDSVCHKEVDDEVSDVQTSADLLPPELKDAILDDLPQDLLDGISVQDIFQDKFLSFEELGKDDTQEESSTSASKIERMRSVKFSRELKRSKSDVLPSNFTHVDSKLHQRSCSLAWSHKLGSNTNCCKAPRLPSNDVSEQTKVIQELRLSVKPAPSIDLHYRLQAPSDKGKENQSLSWPHILQVDGALDSELCSSDEDHFDLDAISHGESEAVLSAIRFSTKIIPDSKLPCDKTQCCKSLASGTQLQIRTPELSTKKVKCRRVNLKNSSRRKGTTLVHNPIVIPQLDGANDPSSDSEQEQCHQKPAVHLSEEKPVQCNRCGCTYRTDESLARHLPNCTGDFSLTTSESEAEISEDDASSHVKSVFATSPDSAISVSSRSLPAAIPAPTAAFPTPLVANSSNSSVIYEGNVSMPAFTNGMAITQPSVSTSNQTQGSCAAPGNRFQRSLFHKSKTKQQTVKLVMKPNQPVSQLQQVFNGSNQPASHQISPSTIQQSLSTQMSHPQTSQVITMLDYPQTQQTGTTVLVQSMPSSTMVPAYLEAFQQQTGQNLQYLATVDPNSGYGKPQYLAAVPSPVIPGAFQLQAISDNQLCLEPGPVAISALSGLQLAQPQITAAPIAQNQPQVLGALLQNSLPCGVVATTEPIYETIQMFPDQSGSVLLASQPMLTCMETVVSNTYMSMSSSQFVSSVPGMLQGSSTYSSTTTQVFQASKVDPPVLDVPAQYVVVNTRPSLSDSALGKLGVISISQSQIQEPVPALSQSQVHMSTINLPTPVSMTACIPPQTLPPAIPTSVVAPIPRIQRTYSKPVKASKEPIIMRRSVPKIHPSGGKETIKNFTSVSVAPCKKRPMPSATGGNLNSMEDMSNASAAPLKPLKLQVSETSKGTAASITVPEVLSSDFISTNIAPAQSITLPDPVKSNAPVAKIPVVPSSSSAAVATKNPPVTFSYRSQNVEKNKDKSSLTVLTGPLSSSVLKSKFDSSFKVEQSTKQCGPLVACPTQPEVNPSQLDPTKSTPSPTVATSVTVERLKVVSGVKKPTAAVSPQLLTNGIQISQDRSQSLQSCTTAPRSKSFSHQLSSNSNLVKVNALALRPPSPKVQSELATASSFNNVMSSEPPQNQVGKNVSLSLVTSSITDSLTSPAASFTVSMNSSAPVPTTKLQSASPLGQAPLKEINLSSPTSKMKVFANKKQEKSGASVPLAVLKSTSQNVDSMKKSDVYHQGELPVMFQNKDKSPTSLKLLFQKQAHNGCYKVSSSPGKIDGDFTAVKLADISIITSGGKDKKGGKDESENVEPVDKASLKKSQTASSGPEIVYEIHCQDGFSYSSTSISEAWQKVFGAVQEARASHKMPPLIHNPFNSLESGHNILGLGNNSVKYILEQLPGVGNCTKYRPIYHKSRLPGSCFPFKQDDHDLLLKETRSGCARTEPYLSAKKYDMFSWLDSRHRRPPKLLDNNDIDYLTGSRRAASTSLPMAMRFRHLRETSRTSVGVFRSDIHGRGLFCLRDIEAGEMVIEYAGEVIRNTLTDNREKYYQSKGIGCYMFKVDDNFTVDATQKGNAARFINHSCEPNCYSRVVDILGKKHIIIFALRRIPQGEELTYDYKFPIEDEKILCHCLSRRCRKYLN